MKKIAITAIGKDRPGIVRDVTGVLLRHRCNLEDTSMTILNGEFAMILIVSLPRHIQLNRLQNDFSAFEKKTHLHVSLSEVKEKPKAMEVHPTCIISVLGADHPGIVHHVAKMLASRKANITDLNSKILHRRGRDVYAMVLEVKAARSVSLESLKQALQKLERQLHVEIHFERIETAVL